MKVSILIPCHNAAAYVGASVRSALDQTWQDKEIIVVDDGSTDDSAKIVEAFKNHNVRLIRQSFGSAALARNRAFEESNGEYIKFLDADDLLERMSIELQMKRLSGGKDAVASAEWGRFYGDDVSTFRLDPQSVWRDMEATEWLVESWMNARPMMQPGLFLAPRAVIERAGPWDGRLSLIDDFEFFARVLSHCKQVRFTPGARLYYRSGLAGSLSGRKSRKAVESAFLSLQLGTSHLLARRQDATAKRACANLFQDFIYTYYPEHQDLLKQMGLRVNELGGSDLPPAGGPRFEKLTRVVGWKFARRLQRWITKDRQSSETRAHRHERVPA